MLEELIAAAKERQEERERKKAEEQQRKAAELKQQRIQAFREKLEAALGDAAKYFTIAHHDDLADGAEWWDYVCADTSYHGVPVQLHYTSQLQGYWVVDTPHVTQRVNDGGRDRDVLRDELLITIGRASDPNPLLS